MEATEATEATLQTGLNPRIRSLFTGLLGGFSAGILNAVFARLLMRVIALVVLGRGSFSVEGTATILIAGVLSGTLFGPLYRSTFYKVRAPTLVKGLLFGIAGLVTLQVPTLFLHPDFRRELMVVGPLGFAVFALMNFAFSLTLAGLVAWLEKTWPRDASRQTIERIVTVVLGLVALGGLGLMFIGIVAMPLGLMK